MRAYPLTILLLFASVAASAAGVKIEINGLPEEQREAVRTSLSLNDYEKRDITPGELISLSQKAPNGASASLPVCSGASTM